MERKMLTSPEEREKYAGEGGGDGKERKIKTKRGVVVGADSPGIYTKKKKRKCESKGMSSLKKIMKSGEKMIEGSLRKRFRRGKCPVVKGWSRKG